MKCSIKTFFVLLFVSAVVFSSCEEEQDNSVAQSFNTLTLNPNSYWNGSDNAGSFKVGEATFPNVYNAAWMSWSGFAYSNQHDVKTEGYGNQYSSYVFKDTASTNTFVVAYPYENANTIVFDNVVSGVKLKVANNTYAALSMKNGDLFAKKFGGADSTQSDWFKLTIIGLDANDKTTDSAQVYLADFRFSSKSQDYILNEWLPVNLSNLGKVKKLKFKLSSTDNNSYGMITPGYFCLDDLEYVPSVKTE